LVRAESAVSHGGAGLLGSYSVAGLSRAPYIMNPYRRRHR